MFETMLNNVMSEYGAFVAFLVLINAVQAYAISKLWKRVTELSDTIVTIVQNNTEVMTKLIERLDHD